MVKHTRIFAEILKASICLTIGGFVFSPTVFAWTEPGQAPPGGNVSAPINTSSGAGFDQALREQQAEINQLQSMVAAQSADMQKIKEKCDLLNK